MPVNTGLFIVILCSTAVSVVLSKTYYTHFGYGSCNSCCPPVQDLQQLPCSSINVELTKKQEALIQINKPKFKQYKKKLLNGKRPNVTVVTFEDDDQIENILERFGDIFKCKKPDRIPKVTLSQPAKPKSTPTPTPNSVAQNADGGSKHAPLWCLEKFRNMNICRPNSWDVRKSTTIRIQSGSKTSYGQSTLSQIVGGKRKKRQAIDKRIEVCPRRESWQDLNLALNTEGKLVQIVQFPDQKQWILEEVCKKKISPILPNLVTCENRPRAVTAVVVPLSGTKGSGEVQVQQIQVHCCASYTAAP